MWSATVRCATFSCDEVLSGRTPLELLAESQRALAFRHTRPAYPVHVVVIPRRHLPSLLKLEDSGLVGELVGLFRRVAGEVLQEQGRCRIVADLGGERESEQLHCDVISGDREAASPRAR